MDVLFFRLHFYGNIYIARFSLFFSDEASEQTNSVDAVSFMKIIFMGLNKRKNLFFSVSIGMRTPPSWGSGLAI